MEIQEQIQGAVTVVKPSGPLTASDAEQFHDVLAGLVDRRLGRLVVDIAGVPYLDSRGIEVLVAVTERLGESGQSLKLCGVNETLTQVLKLTGWSTSFEFFDDVNTGIRSFL